MSLKNLAQPVINSFSPSSGPVGTSLTINGANFSSTLTNNIVFIGSVRAEVTAATSTTLTVTVPAGAIFESLSVTINGLTAYSNKPFVVTFSGAPPLTGTSFEYAARVDSVSSDIETTKFAVGDINDDKLIDVVVVDRLNNTMSVYANSASAGGITFASKIDFTTGVRPRAVAIKDVDGDGKPDIIVTNLGSNTVSIFRNTTSGGVISFAPKVDFATATQPATISVTDVDKDGKPDLVINTINLDGFISILRNTGSIGSISFAASTDLRAVGGSIEEIRTADMDGDGKPDILLPDFASNVVKIFRNTSTTGNISFAVPTTVNASVNPDNLEIADFNDDGKPDLAISHYSNNRVWFYKNQSTSGNINLQFSNSFPTGTFVSGLATNDLDGDGKPDLAINVSQESIYLFKNTSTTGGEITFSSIPLPYAGGSHVVSGDFDNDGKPDLALNTGVFRVTIWKNVIARPQIASFSPISAKEGDVVTINGNNFTNATAVSFGGIPATSFTVVSSTKITAVVGPGATGDVKIVSPSGSGKLPGFLFLGPPVITGFTPVTATSFDRVIITGQNFTGTTDVKFGGVQAPFNLIDASTIEAAVGAGASGDVSVTNPYGTAIKPGFIYVPKPFITSFSPVDAIAGTTITIKGLNLSGTTSVSFGGVPATSFTVVDSVTVQAIVANGSTGNVSLTTSYGTAVKTGFAYYPPPVITSFTPVEAAQGELVTITGRNFLHNYQGSYVSAVKFGGTPAFSFDIIDSFTIVAKVYGGASGPITVESNRGNASLPGFTFIPQPVIISVDPKIIAQGTEVTITGYNLDRTTSVDFGGTPASSFTIISPDTIRAIVGSGASGYVIIRTPKHSAQGAPVEYTSKPFIYKVTPTSGPVGATVTISGINFQPGASNNTVFFGGVKANILSATADKIMVTVPAGTNYKQISVSSQSNKLTAVSNVRFDVTFPVDTAAFNDSSFAGRMDFTTGSAPFAVKHMDVDGDGKLDMIVLNNGSTFISVFRNLSVAGRLSFAPRVDIEIGFNAKAMNIADMDADSKPDLIISNDIGTGTNSPKIFIFRNQSTPGNIAFINAGSIGGYFFFPGFIETGDFNLDGRMDIVSLCTNCRGPGRIEICENTGSNGSISFSEPRTYSFNGSDNGIISGLTVTDYNRDGKPDIIVGMILSSALYVFKNTTQIGSFTFFDPFVVDNYGAYAGFTTFVPYPVMFGPGEFPGISAGQFAYSNNSGNLSLDLNTQTITRYVYDLNGDGRQDILGNDIISNNLSLLKNTSNNNSITFAPSYQMDEQANALEVGDLDGDSKPEICAVYPSSNILRIFRNRMGEAAPPKPSLLSFNPQTAKYSDKVLIKGSNLNQVTSVTFGGIPAQYFTVISADSIEATVAGGASGRVKISSPGGADSLDGFTFIPAPVINAFVPAQAASGQTVIITGSNFTGATAVSFGGVPAGSFNIISSDSISAKVGSGASGNVVITAPGGTATRSGFTYIYPVINSFSPIFGSTDTVVTIKGNFLAGATAVSFGGVAAKSFTVVDSATVRAVVGNGASGKVSLTTPIGTATGSDFIYFLPAPIITSFTPVTAGAGTTVTITGKYFNAAQSVKFGGVPAASFTLVDTTTITAVVGSGTTGDVSVGTPSGTALLGGFTFITVTGIIDPGNVNSSELTVSPNPVHGILTIRHPVSAKGTTLRFINILGYEVKRVIPARNAAITETNVSGLHPGVYMIIWSDGLRNLSRVIMVL